MDRLTSLDAFKAFTARLAMDPGRALPVIVISAGTCGRAGGANDLIKMAQRTILEDNLTHRLRLRVTGCHGFCETEPSLLVEPNRTFYPKIQPQDVARVVRAAARREAVGDLLPVDPRSGKPIETQEDLPFYQRQHRSVMARNEKVDPRRITDYLAIGGYGSLIRALEKRDPAWVVGEVKASGLRGRGGAGFPTGRKWEMLAARSADKGKYLICNADEGDPGAYMDRSVLEGNPHSIVEGMLIGAYATGATAGVVYVRNEYPLAIQHLTLALDQAREAGLLGEDILGTGFSFDIRIVKGAGAFVCGEETALIRSVEGEMGEPRQRPPFPVERGIGGRPTAINNVETWANIPLIIQEGGAAYAKTGTASSAGTKIFSLVGKVKNTGLVEVPMGMTIKEIVFDIGDGSRTREKIKAVQTGGPSGGCIPVDQFDLPIDYDSLTKAGSIMGSGGMIVMDEATCMVDLAKYFMTFLKDESCGKCFTCRKGTQRMYEILDDISKGKGTRETLDLLKELAEAVKDTTMCGLGQTAANPVLSTLRYFREEYLAHLEEGRCPAGVCKDLVGAPCQAACPIGTEAWKYVAHIARGEYEEAYRTIREANPFPSVCARVCSHPCEYKCRAGTTGGEAIAIRALKRFITDRIDPSIYKPVRSALPPGMDARIAVIGSGPAGMTAAHYLSLKGYKVTVFEKVSQPGGMLTTGIPSYRMPRETLQKEIACLLDQNVTLRLNTELGKDITLDGLQKEGYKAVFLAMGAHKSKLLNIEGEDLDGVYPALEFLQAFNLRGEKLAKRRVGVIGGGDSAVDAARVALRQPGVESVTILYRRTRQEMPALQHEIDAALEEGVKLVTLVAPVRITTENGKLAGVECIQNRLGDVDRNGRRNPVPIPGSEYAIPLDTLIVTIGDIPDVEYIASMGIAVDQWGTLLVDKGTLLTNKPGVFAGGDVITGPNTVVAAIAAGKKAATMIDRYVRGEPFKQPPTIRLPEVYLAPPEEGEEVQPQEARIALPTIPVTERRVSLKEVELTLGEADARREARRCMRCDLEFTRPPAEQGKNTERTEHPSHGSV